MNKIDFKNILRNLHLWLGLSFGIIFSIGGLSGSFLVFQKDIDTLLNKEIISSSPITSNPWETQVWDNSISTLRKKWPDRYGPWRIEVDANLNQIAARYKIKEKGQNPKLLLVWLSPDGKQIVREEYWGKTLVTYIYDLHMSLLQGAKGTIFIGICGIIYLFILISGFINWLPKKSILKNLKINFKAHPIVKLRDFHKIIGLVALPILALNSATGIMLALPNQTTNLVQKLELKQDANAPLPKSIISSSEQIKIQTAMKNAKNAIPNSRLAWIEVPNKDDGVITFKVQSLGDPNIRFPTSYINVDQYNGQVLKVFNSNDGGFASKILLWIRPLHDASAGGIIYRCILLLFGFAPILLFTLGFIRWNKMRQMKIGDKK